MGVIASVQTTLKTCPGRAPELAPELASEPAPEFAPEHPARRAIDAVRCATTAAAARDWLETQARVVEYWRDLLADAGATDELIEALDVHAAFLNGVVTRG